MIGANERAGQRPGSAITSPSRPAFTLIEMVLVVSLLTILLSLIATTLLGAIRMQQADTAALRVQMLCSSLADRFRQDVGRATTVLDPDGKLAEGCTTLRLERPDGGRIEYRAVQGAVERTEQGGQQKWRQVLSLGSDEAEVTFRRDDRSPRLITMRLTTRRGPPSSRRLWHLDISAALGGLNR